MPSQAFENSRGRCQLPELPKVPASPFIDDCSLPDVPSRSIQLTPLDVPVLPYVPDCPALDIGSKLELIGYGPLSLDVDGGQRTEDICPGDCGYRFDVNLRLPIDPDISETGYIPVFDRSPPRRLPRQDTAGLAALDRQGKLVLVDSDSQSSADGPEIRAEEIAVTTARVTRGNSVVLAVFARTLGNPIDTGRRVIAWYDWFGTEPIEANVEVATRQYADVIRITNPGHNQPRTFGSTPSAAGF